MPGCSQPGVHCTSLLQKLLLSRDPSPIAIKIGTNAQKLVKATKNTADLIAFINRSVLDLAQEFLIFKWCIS